MYSQYSTANFPFGFFGSFRILSPPSQPIRAWQAAVIGACSFSRCINAILPRNNEEYLNMLQKNSVTLKWHETDGKATVSSQITESVDLIKSMLTSTDDGVISISAYDTAWVALVEDVNGSGGPQFPSSLNWIADNQLPDGSWGFDSIFSIHDRVLSTLACVVALRTWNIHPDKSEKGISFIKENIHKLEDTNEEHMSIGFEVAFPTLVERAGKAGIEFPENPFLQEISAKRDLKLTKIPKDVMHSVPTTLLFSLEGMPELDWEKLIKLQSTDGSFLFSPSSTAFALMETKDENCLKYLNSVVAKFNGGVPNAYPVDMFEHIWAIDRLQRLGISRYFQKEIKECIHYVHRYWTNNGICWARSTPVQDVDDTAMGFRLLRLHGYQVSADVFKQFKYGEEFFCYAGESNQAITGMYNLYRASQMLFPHEKILDDAKKFTYSFLREKEASNKLLDKWIITKDLPGEVGYALDVPWYASLPRVETRFYLEQYGGEEDVWIGKTLYRMPYVNNNIYLELGKLDFNKCQAIHQLEWNDMQQWHTDSNLEELESSKNSLLFSYYLALASIFEPERSIERISWAKTANLVEAIRSFLLITSEKQRREFVDGFRNTTSVGSQDYFHNSRPIQELLRTVLRTLDQLSLGAQVSHGRDIRLQLHHAWDMWLTKWQEGCNMPKGEAEIIVWTVNLCAGRCLSEDLLSHPCYRRLSDITNTVCHQLHNWQQNKEYYPTRGVTNVEIESNMQELVQLVLGDSASGLDPDLKQTFLTVAKTYYYSAHCSPETINTHIARVLFEYVI